MLLPGQASWPRVLHNPNVEDAGYVHAAAHACMRRTPGPHGAVGEENPQLVTVVLASRPAIRA